MFVSFVWFVLCLGQTFGSDNQKNQTNKTNQIDQINPDQPDKAAVKGDISKLSRIEMQPWNSFEMRVEAIH